MQFALLCDFLEGKGVIDSVRIGKTMQNKTDSVSMWKYPRRKEVVGSTKQEAIEKAIEYLNDNYEH